MQQTGLVAAVYGNHVLYISDVTLDHIKVQLASAVDKKTVPTTLTTIFSEHDEIVVGI